MPTLRNTTDEHLDLPYGHQIEPYGDLSLLTGDMARVIAHGAVRALLLTGRVVIRPDPASDAGIDLSRSGIARAKRADLVAVGEAHGLTPVQMRVMNVEELREAVTRIVFLDA